MAIKEQFIESAKWLSLFSSFYFFAFGVVATVVGWDMWSSYPTILEGEKVSCL